VSRGGGGGGPTLHANSEKKKERVESNKASTAQNNNLWGLGDAESFRPKKSVGRRAEVTYLQHRKKAELMILKE